LLLHLFGRLGILIVFFHTRCIDRLTDSAEPALDADGKIKSTGALSTFLT